MTDGRLFTGIGLLCTMSPPAAIDPSDGAARALGVIREAALRVDADGLVASVGPAAALEAVADRIGASGAPEVVPAAPETPVPAGPLTPVAIGQSLVRSLPEEAIVVDEAATCGMGIFPATLQAPRHDWLTLTGGAIGYGLPAALGAAIACPDRKVVALQADGSAMYTIQALWSMARENSDVTVVIMNNEIILSQLLQVE